MEIWIHMEDSFCILFEKVYALESVAFCCIHESEVTEMDDTFYDTEYSDECINIKIMFLQQTSLI